MEREFASTRLVGHVVLALACCLGTAMVVDGVYTALTEDGTQASHGLGMAALGVPLVCGAGGGLLWGALRRREHGRLLRAWARVVDDPSVLALAAPRARGYRPGALQPPRMTGRRLWLGGPSLLGLFLGCVMFVDAVLREDGTSGSDVGDSTVFAAVSVVAVPLACAGLWKSLRLCVVVPRMGPMSAAMRRRVGRSRQGWREGTRYELPDILATVEPDSPMYRRLRRTPPWGAALLAAASATVVALLGARLLGLVGWIAAMPLAVFLILVVMMYDLRLWYVGPAMGAALALFIITPGYERERALSDRGEWTEATVTEVRESEGSTTSRGSRRCAVEFSEPRFDGDSVPCPWTYGVGDEMRLLVDPEGAVAPSRTEPDTVSFRYIIIGSSALFVVATAGGVWTGHRYRFAGSGERGDRALSK